MQKLQFRLQSGFVFVVLCLLFLSGPLVWCQTDEFGTSIQIFPQIVGGAGATTSFTIHSTSTLPEIVRIEMFATDGKPLAQQSIQLPPGGTQTVTINTSGQLTSGWARLTSTQKFSSSALFQITGLNQVGVLPSSSTKRLQLPVFVRDQLRSGVAIANPIDTAPSTVTITLLDPNGRPGSTRQIVLQPGGHLARFWNEDPLFTNIGSFEGTADISATSPVSAVALRLDGSQLSTLGATLPEGLLADGSVTSLKLAPATIVKSLLVKNPNADPLKPETEFLVFQDDVKLAAATGLSIKPIKSDKDNSLVLGLEFPARFTDSVSTISLLSGDTIFSTPSGSSIKATAFFDNRGNDVSFPTLVAKGATAAVFINPSGNFASFGDGGYAGIFQGAVDIRPPFLRNNEALTVGGNLVVKGSINPPSSKENLTVGADLIVKGRVTKTAGAFIIDHPLDPQNKYLFHSFVESPDMMNIYNGNVTLNEYGESCVEMPPWFEALNRDYRYQLTAIGFPGPNLYIAEELTAGHFKIAGGAPGGKVSWQITGIRQDPYANAHRVQVEEEKPASQRGLFLFPEGYSQPASKGISYGGRPRQ